MPRFARTVARVLTVFVGAAALLSLQHALRADSTAQALPFSQSWTDTSLITLSNDWSAVPGIIGHRGDDLTTLTGTDPQTILVDGTSTPVSVFPNQSNGTAPSGGVGEFDGIANPTIAIQGSGTADAPFILIHLNTTGLTSVNVAYNLRDLDPSADNATQQVALQYRIGSSGSFTNLPAGYVADATDALSNTRVTPVSVTLPADADDQPLVQIRVITTNAVGNDEWVGIDDIDITASSSDPTDPTATAAAMPASVPRGSTTVLTVSVTPGANPTSTALSVTGDLSSIDGSATTAFFDDGLAPDVTAGDNIFSFPATVPMAVTAGVKQLPVTVLDAQSRMASATITLEVLDPTVPPVVSVEPLPFNQDWTDVNLIGVNDNWSNVPGIAGYLGDYDPGTPTAVDPQTILTDLASTTVDVIANQTNTSTTSGGVAEFELSNPIIALQGSGTADAPNVVLHVNTTGHSSIVVSYALRDIDGSADNAIQPVALQYRVGSSGPFASVPAGFVADATTGPNLADLVTTVSATLPADADDNPLVQIRIITSNAAGSDEWVGIDDIRVSAGPTDPTATGAASPAVVSAGGDTLLTVTVTPGANPASTGIAVAANLSLIGGLPSQPLLDDGTKGDATAGDNIFSYSATIAEDTAVGLKALPVTISDAQSRTAAVEIQLDVTAAATHPTAAGAATPGTVMKSSSTLFTVTVTPGTNPTSSALGVSVDLSAIAGLASQPFFDDGTNGDASAGDLVFSLQYTVPLAATAGPHALSVTVTDGEGRSGATTIALTVFDPPATTQPLPFAQDWTNAGLVTANDNWAGVPGIVGYLGDYTASTPTGVDPQTLVSDMTSTAIDVIANQSNTNITNGGVAEFDGIANPTVALQGSGTADAPHILLSLNTTGFTDIAVAYTLRDIDGSSDNAVQAVALQYRVGSTGNFTNLPAGFVADATTGPSLATLVTPVSVQLPSAVWNQPFVQVRIVTTNASGSDEWVGIDDISVTGSNDPTNPIGQGAANPSSVETGSTTLLTVTVTGGINPTSTGLAVTTNLSPIGGPGTQVFFDDGSNGDATSGDNVFSYLATIPASATAGSKILPFTVSDAQSRSTTGSIVFSVLRPTPFLTIGQIQGTGTVSPYAGETVRTNGIVTGRKGNGFFVQSAADDGDPATSDGIFVFTLSLPPAVAAVGTLVEVTGQVQEFVPAADPVQPPMTELGNSPLVTLVSSDHPLPAPVVLTAADTDGAGKIEDLERFEGRRVEAESLTVVSPTQGTFSETNATSTSNGVFYGVISGVARPFREPGIPVPDPLPPGAPLNVPRFDANPERLRVDSDGIGAALLDVAAGQLLTNVVGPLDYAFRTYTILPEPGAIVVVDTPSPTPVSQPTPNQFTVGSTNLQRFFDTVNDPAIGEPVLTPAAFNNRLNKASLFIRDIMKSPDVIGTVEVENLSTLQTLASRVNDDSVAAGLPNPNYIAHLEEGNDSGGIDVGFLVKSSRVSSVEVIQEGRAATFIDPTDGSVDTLNDRPPLVLSALVQNPTGAAAFPITVIVNHLRSLIDIEDPRVGAKRRGQAEFLANLIQARQTANPRERILAVGDFNAFEFNDGYVDVIGTIKGSPAPASEVVLSSPDLVSPDLSDLVDTVPAAERYSYTFDGNAQVLDHAIVSSNLQAQVDGIQFARINADFPETARNDTTRPTRLSDHDPLVVFFSFPLPAGTQTTITPSGNPAAFGQSVSFTATVTDGSGTPVTEGTLTFKEDGLVLSGPTVLNGSGQASLTTSGLSVGSHVITAEYSGTAYFHPSAGGVTESVRPALSITDVTVNEPDAGGTAAATFTVTLLPAFNSTVTVQFTTANGTATAGVDYVAAASTTLTFPAATTTQTVDVSVIGDLLNEADETFTINLSDPINALIVDDQGVGTIANDDPQPNVEINDISVREGDSGTGNATFTLRLSAVSGQTVLVNVATGDDTATSAMDYVETSGTVTFLPGSLVQTVTVGIRGDAINEANETFLVNLSDVTNAALPDPAGRGTIVNDDPLPRLSIDDVTVREPQGGTTIATFTVGLATTSEQTVSVDFATTSVTAVAGSDYLGVPVSPPSTLLFAAGETSRTIGVIVNADALLERPEEFRVTLFRPINGVLADTFGRGTINDVNAPGVDDFSPPSGAIGTSVTIVGDNLARVTAVRFNGSPARFRIVSPTEIAAIVPHGASDGPISVTSQLGTATSAEAFRIAPRIANFSPGAGRIGAHVVIRGTGFDGVTGAQFNAAPATILGSTATTIRVIVPDGATTGPIAVTTPVGTATTENLVVPEFRVLP